MSMRIYLLIKFIVFHGKMLLSEKPNAKEALLAAQIPSGIYLLRYTSATGEAGSLKIVSVNQQ